MSRLLCAVALIAATGCADSRPTLDPNEHLDRVGRPAADCDVGECRRRADADVSSTQGREVARGTAVGGGVGAASGAVGGAIYGVPRTGAAIGAASGATAGLLHGLLDAGHPSPTYQSYVKACFADRGYRVIGWE